MVTMPRWKLGLLWALSLVVVTALTAAAQARRGQPSGNDFLTLESPTVLTGPDVGFRTNLSCELSPLPPCLLSQTA